jgi:8-oxo-dGTP pyrophosphatase MutT (NUDIX family)
MNENQVLYFSDESELLLFWYEFQLLTTVIPAAGGIIQYEEKYLWMKRRGMWDLPKGKIDPGEIPAQAALREVAEETGLKQVVIKDFVGATWHIYFHKNKWVLKPTYWFAMSALDVTGLQAQVEEDIEELKWVDLGDVQALDTFASIREIWSKYLTR